MPPISAIGAYTCAILMKTYGVPFALALRRGRRRTPPLCALLFGAFCVRSTKIYFSMLTLAFAQIVWAICFKWNSVTGGEQGFNNVPYPDLGLDGGDAGCSAACAPATSSICVVLVLTGIAFALLQRDRRLAVRPHADRDPREPGARRVHRHQRAALPARRLRRGRRLRRASPARCSASSTAASSPTSPTGRSRPRC